MQTADVKVASARRAALLARLTLAGIAVYVILDVVAQALPPHFSPITQAESDLAVGPYGWVMMVNFVVRGVLSLAMVQALRDGLPAPARGRVGEALLTIWALGAIILAFAPTDLPGQKPTLHGEVHLVVAAIAFAAGAIGEVLVSLRLGADPRLRAIAAAAKVIAIGALVMLVVVVVVAAHAFGLAERIFLVLILLWLAVVAARVQSVAVAA